ncbi:MAG: CRISPR-associated protein Csx3, partial [Candidatus Desantisbacteria bacterium]
VSYLKTEHSVTIDGGGAVFVYATIAHAVYPAAVKIRDPKVEGDYVKIPSLKMVNEGSDHLKWKIEDRGNYTFIEFSVSCPSGAFVVADLPNVIVPEVSQKKGIVISGRGSIWLTVAIVMAYRNADWIALFRPQDHVAMVVVRNTPHAPQLGEVIRDIYQVKTD